MIRSIIENLKSIMGTGLSGTVCQRMCFVNKEYTYTHKLHTQGVPRYSLWTRELNIAIT